VSSELEHRLEGLFAEAPEPAPGAGEEALHRALRALQPAAPARRGLRTAALVLAAAVVLLVIAAGSLAAAGALHVSFGAKAKPRPARAQLTLPTGADGIAAIVDGRLTVVTHGGFRLQVPATAAALSPHALFIAAGIGDSLVAMAPNGRRAWSHPARGRVVAIAWRPDGLQIAYIVRSSDHLALHLIYGNGEKDTTIDRSVRAVRPSWRADSLALAYVGAGGKAIVYDLSHQTHSVVATAAPVTHVAFGPSGSGLAVATPNTAVLGDKRIVTGQVEGLGWLRGHLAVVVPGSDSATIRLFSPGGASRGVDGVHGTVVAVTPKLVLVRDAQRLLAGHTTLLTVPRRATVSDLAIG
jgi:hypothetical protein